jgi:hypothetical protein
MVGHACRALEPSPPCSTLARSDHPRRPPARCETGTKRRFLPGAEGIRVLALDGIPGKLYERPEPFGLGAPDPTVAA